MALLACLLFSKGSLNAVWLYMLIHVCSFCVCCLIFTDHIQRLLNRGSYMSAHVLLNLLNELGKRDKMRGLPSILSHFCNSFDKFNNTRARMLDSIYHMTLI